MHEPLLFKRKQGLVPFFRGLADLHHPDAVQAVAGLGHDHVRNHRHILLLQSALRRRDRNGDAVVCGELRNINCMQ